MLCTARGDEGACLRSHRWCYSWTWTCSAWVPDPAALCCAPQQSWLLSLGLHQWARGTISAFLSALKAACQFQRSTENFHLPFSFWSGYLIHGPYLVPEQGLLASWSKHSQGPWLWYTLSWMPGSTWFRQLWAPLRPHPWRVPCLMKETYLWITTAPCAQVINQVWTVSGDNDGNNNTLYWDCFQSWLVRR